MFGRTPETQSETLLLSVYCTWTTHPFPSFYSNDTNPTGICHLRHNSLANQHFIQKLHTGSCVCECFALPLRSELIRSLSLVRWVASTAVTMATHDYLAAWSFVLDIEAFITGMLGSVT